ncbi:MAG: hypothetical protein P9M14_11965 [Candidatus Alcyoniella australis]|nr:hypothetical protein [Candidatus Alcyoniella australis]
MGSVVRRLLLILLVLSLLPAAACDSVDQTDHDDDDAGEDEIDDDDLDDDDEPYPPGLPFSFIRQDDSEPIPAQQLIAFSELLRDFYEQSSYADWLLRMSHGVDSSTGMRDYRLWWGEVYAEKHGDTVSIIHKYSEEHGGHNILKSNSLLLSSAIGWYLASGDPLLGELTQQFCAGISSTMLGMVHDESDPLQHLMARNVAAFNHGYTTHDGRKKYVDYSNWFHPYDRWNCSRFRYTDNPYWGEVWVTNTRSKDGLGYLFKTAVSIDHAAQHAADPQVRQTCGETRDLLRLFARDIVDNAYLIRSKDSQGNAYRPGIDPEPEEARIGDIVSFTAWDWLVPDAECNAKCASALLAYGDPLNNDCDSLDGPGIYELGAIINNPPNAHIMRSLHIANIALALHSGHNDLALKGLDGLEKRFERDMTLDLSLIDVEPDNYFRDIAVNLLQSATAGYYLTNDEVRLIQAYAFRSITQYQDFENWDPWDDSVPEDQQLEVFPPTSRRLEDQTVEAWFHTYVLGLFMDYCWGLYRNPDSPLIVDCSVLTR